MKPYERTFNVDLPCPKCGKKKILGWIFTNDAELHQNTFYNCISWPNGGPRCGWQGWTVSEQLPGMTSEDLDNQEIKFLKDKVKTLERDAKVMMYDLTYIHGELAKRHILAEEAKKKIAIDDYIQSCDYLDGDNEGSISYTDQNDHVIILDTAAELLEELSDTDVLTSVWEHDEIYSLRQIAYTIIEMFRHSNHSMYYMTLRKQLKGLETYGYKPL